MSELVGIARFKFHEGNVEEFKRLSAQAMDGDQGERGRLRTPVPVGAAGWPTSQDN